jgi:putative endonuclease
MTDKIKTGVKGENLAAEFLVNKGFRIVTKNFRYGRGEIDLIVSREDWLIFVEVKTRSSFDYGPPEQFVHTYQIKRIFDAAEAFIFKIDWQGHVRFDVVSVRLEEGTEIPLEILHFEDAIN